jgi:hypothetical protein
MDQALNPTGLGWRQCLAPLMAGTEARPTIKNQLQQSGAQFGDP